MPTIDSLTYCLKQLQQVSSSFIGDLLGIDGLGSRRRGHYIVHQQVKMVQLEIGTP